MEDFLGETLYQGNSVIITKGNLKWFKQIGVVVDNPENPYPNYPVKVYFPHYEITEYFTEDQVEKL